MQSEKIDLLNYFNKHLPYCEQEIKVLLNDFRAYIGTEISTLFRVYLMSIPLSVMVKIIVSLTSMCVQQRD